MALGSCTNKSRIENDYKNLVGSEIKIPYDSFDVVSYGLINDDRHKEWTFVSYVDSVECTPCHMSHVNQWERVQELFKKTGNGLRVVLIYCPRKQMVEDIKKNYRQSECSYVIYLDTMRRFRAIIRRYRRTARCIPCYWILPDMWFLLAIRHVMSK